MAFQKETVTRDTSKDVYISEPDTTKRKFDIKIIESDLTVVFDNTIQKGVLLSPNNTIVHGNLSDHFISAITAPSISWGFWYDLTNNQIKWTQDGSTWTSGYSFPICIGTGTNGSVTSIDQVFNGFGYMGSTVYALPGVKGLIPNGRNADGSLKSTEFTVDKVLDKSHPNQTWDNLLLVVNPDDIGFVDFPNNWNYIEQENKIISISDGSQKSYAVAGKGSCASSKITSFTPKTVFHTLDYNDRETVVSWSMPSSRYINLTLGASGTTYTAPANGYFQIWKIAGIVEAFFNFVNKTNNAAINSNTTKSEYSSRMMLPVRKGDVIECTYNSTGSTLVFRFIYAEGEPYN